MRMDEILRIANLRLRSRKVFEGLYSGYHSSLKFGASMEFAEYRQYVMGDDIRFLDWKAYARKNKLFTRKFYEETNVDVILMLDVSNSMGFGNKMEYSKTIAGVFSYIFHAQRDRVGLLLFSDRLHAFLKPSTNIDPIFETLETVKPSGKTYMSKILKVIPSLIGRKSIIILISDMETDEKTIYKLIAGFERIGYDTWVIHLLSDEERDLSERGIYEFYDMEVGEKAIFNSSLFHKDYMKIFKRWLNEVKNNIISTGSYYKLIFTDEPIYRIFIP